MALENPKTITVDGVEYQVANLSVQTQALVTIHTTWREELQKARLEVAKLEAALRSLEVELLTSVKKDTEPKSEAGAAAQQPAAANEPPAVGR
jgi:hypothetical protein